MKSEGSERSEVSEGSLEKVQKPTIREILDYAKPRLKPAFKEEDLLREIMPLGFTRQEADRIVEHLLDQELIGRDDLGLYHWYKG